VRLILPKIPDRASVMGIERCAACAANVRTENIAAEVCPPDTYGVFGRRWLEEEKKAVIENWQDSRKLKVRRAQVIR
jgi:hypothetical protein